MRTILSAFVCMLLQPIAAQETTHIQGRVYLNDTLPAAYATLFLPDYGIGTITDEEGNYTLDGVPVGASIAFEYSYVGYQTATVKLALPLANHRYAHDEHLHEQAIVLNEVYLTPNGEDPVKYIARKVNEQTENNRKRLVGYKASVDAYCHAADIDLVPMLMPGVMMSTIRGAAKMAGVGALLDFATENPKIDVHYTYTQTKEKNRYRNGKISVISSSPAISDKARQQLEAPGNFFDLLYDEGLNFTPKNAVKKGWKLQGIIEEQGHDVDVLTRTLCNEHDTVYYKLYVIEDLWTILRYEENSTMGLERYECRDIGGGIYMPVSYVTKPIPMDFNTELDRITQLVDSIKTVAGVDDLRDVKVKGLKQRLGMKMFISMMERAEKIRNTGRIFRPVFDCPYTISYSEVNVK